MGRKPLDQETINLILELKNLNPKWGAQKISDELMKIGYLACKKTVLKYLEIYGLGPEPSSRAMPWGEFLANHKFKIGIDFTCLISLSGRQLFIFVIKNLDSREVLLINSTFYPNSSWITQQFRNASYDLDVYPSLFLCDRDRIFSKWFPHMMRDYFGTKVKYTPPKSPWKNGIVERFNKTLKEEVFDNVVPITLGQTQRPCNEYQKYFNESRPHQGLKGKIPSKLNKVVPRGKASFEKVKHLGGKIVSLEPTFLAAA